MSIKRLTIDGNGQLELNNVAFRRDGRVEAQCKLADNFNDAPAENGMLLAVNNVTRTVELPEADGVYPIALNYTTEHMFDERANALKDFSLKPGTYLPRLGYLSVGDKFTTNTVAYDDSEFTGDDAVKAAARGVATTPLYGGICENGAIKVSATAPTDGPVLLAVLATTMPDGQFGIKFQCAKA